MSTHVGKSDTKCKGKIANAERCLGRFNLNSTRMPPWQLSSNDLKLANLRLKDIHIPIHLDFNPTFMFTNPTRLKSHDWKQVT